jgi:hypothetical protein
VEARLALLHQTYELYLQSDEGPPIFMAITCAPGQSVHQIAHAILAERQLPAVEVRQFGEHLFEIRAGSIQGSGASSTME